MLIISNNPMTWEKFPESLRVEGTSLEVMEEIRSMVQKGMRLISHPLSGNARLVRNPFRSVVLKKAVSEVNPRDLLLVEDAYYRLKQVDSGAAPQSSLEDYQIIDLDLLMSTIGPY